MKNTLWRFIKGPPYFLFLVRLSISKHSRVAFGEDVDPCFIEEIQLY